MYCEEITRAFKADGKRNRMLYEKKQKRNDEKQLGNWVVNLGNE